MNASALVLDFMPIYCLIVAVTIGVWRYRAPIRLVDKHLAHFSFSQRVISALLAPPALVADWNALSWVAYNWISPEKSLASADIDSAILLEVVALLVLVFAYVLARVSVRRVSLPAPWLDKLIASRNRTGQGALHEQ